jgi:WD40 repeat protein
VRIWDFITEKPRIDLKGPQAAIQQAVISPDGTLVAAVSEEPSVWVWNLQSGAMVATLSFSPDLVSQYKDPTFPHTLQVQFAPDGKTVVANSLLGVTWWDLQTKQERHFFPMLAAELKKFREQALVPVEKNAVSCLSAFNLDGKVLAVGTPFKVYLLSWPSGGGLASLATGKPLVEMRWMQNGLLGLFHPGVVSVWDTVLNKQVQSFASLKTQLPNLPPNAGFRQDGKWMAVEVESARGLPGGLKVVELPSGLTLLTVDPHTDNVVQNPQFSQDGKLLFGSSGGDLFIWDTTTGKELRRIGNRKGFTSMSADGKLFVEFSTNDTSLWGISAAP